MTRFVGVPVGQGGLSRMGIGSERAGCNDPRGPGAKGNGGEGGWRHTVDAVGMQPAGHPRLCAFAIPVF